MVANGGISRGQFILEAKTGPNVWEPVETLYPQGDFHGTFSHEGAARLAKAALKTWLHGKAKGRYKKYPIRVTELPGKPDTETVLEQLARAVVEMDGRAMETWVDMALDQEIPIHRVMTRALFKGLDQVGEMADKGCVFLQDLEACVGLVTRARNRLTRGRPLLPWSDRPVVIGSIQGDVHGAGKDMVKAMLEAAGFTCVDLGQDVPLEGFSRAVVREGAGLVCISCSLETAVPGVAWATAHIRQTLGAQRIPVMVGGGAISVEFARTIGADGHGANAASAVGKAASLMDGGLPPGAEMSWGERARKRGWG